MLLTTPKGLYKPARTREGELTFGPTGNRGSPSWQTVDVRHALRINPVRCPRAEITGRGSRRPDGG